MLTIERAKEENPVRIRFHRLEKHGMVTLVRLEKKIKISEGEKKKKITVA